MRTWCWMHFRSDYGLTQNNIPKAVNPFHLTRTYDFCLFISQGLIEKNLFHTKGVSRGKNDSCGGHGRVAVLLLQAVRDDEEDSEADVHPLQRKQTQEEEIRAMHFICQGAGRKKDRRNLIFLPDIVNQQRQQSLLWFQISRWAHALLGSLALLVAKAHLTPLCTFSTSMTLSAALSPPPPKTTFFSSQEETTSTTLFPQVTAIY